MDTGCRLANMLLVNPNILQSSEFEVGPKDYLIELVRILGMEKEGNSKYLQLLAIRQAKKSVLGINCKESCLLMLDHFVFATLIAIEALMRPIRCATQG